MIAKIFARHLSTKYQFSVPVFDYKRWRYYDVTKLFNNNIIFNIQYSTDSLDESLDESDELDETDESDESDDDLYEYQIEKLMF